MADQCRTGGNVSHSEIDQTLSANPAAIERVRSEWYEVKRNPNKGNELGLYDGISDSEVHISIHNCVRENALNRNWIDE